jgi:hypothetical protein
MRQAERHAGRAAGTGTGCRRDAVSAIALQFTTEADPVSALIRAFSHGAFSHVDAVLPDGNLLGARADGGVQARPPGYAPFTRLLRVALSATDDQAAAFHHFLDAQRGRPYDLRAIAAFAADRDWRRPDSWFCSELQCAALEAAGWLRHRLATPANRITPADLLLLCSAFVDVAVA